MKDSTLAIVHYDLGLLYLFTPKMPGLTEADQAGVAIRELEAYKSMRGQKEKGAAQADDIDELLNRAKSKQAEIRTRSAAVASAPAASGSAAPPPAASRGRRA